MPEDFRFLTTVYASIANQIGSLPTRLVGEVVLLYAGFEATSRIPQQFAHTLELRDEMRSQQGRLQGAGIQLQATIDARTKDLAFQLTTFRSGVAVALERSNGVLPKLRRASVPGWRLDYLLRKKRRLSLDIVRQYAAEHAVRLGLK